MNKNTGFTLVEVLVVISIVTLISIAAFSHYKISESQSKFSHFSNKIEILRPLVFEAFISKCNSNYTISVQDYINSGRINQLDLLNPYSSEQFYFHIDTSISMAQIRINRGVIPSAEFSGAALRTNPDVINENYFAWDAAPNFDTYSALEARLRFELGVINCL